MSFTTLVYHEVRENTQLHPPQPSPIDVKQDYEDKLPTPLFVDIADFKAQMAYLADQQYHTLTLEEVRAYYYEGAQLPEKSVLLTFDDCFQSIKHYVYPILKQHGFTAVLFVVTGWLHDEPRPFTPERSVCLAGSELADMSDVFTTANHTDVLHQRSSLTESIIMTVSDEVFAADLDKCNLSTHVEVKDCFAYPFGLYEERNVALLKQKGFKLGFTTKPGPNTEATAPLELNRTVVPFGLPLEQFKTLV